MKKTSFTLKEMLRFGGRPPTKKEKEKILRKTIREQKQKILRDKNKKTK